ncbi:DMT family transporter [Sulfitobacter aestuarii]|uniref:DMT family transporter n=1 Tax=Sulfitobacter aestuarii TaxID=2161676 RepID=A0ABW5TX84_9RHOB
MNAPVFALILTAIAGGAVALQTPINAALGRNIGSGLAAATISFGIGFLTLLLISLLTGQGSALSRLTAAPPALLIGGALGAFYVWTALWAISSLGALTTVTALILGQLSAALLLDATGLFGLMVQPISPARIAAAVLVTGGVVLSRF